MRAARTSPTSSRCALCLGELRAVKRLPHPIDIFIPYRLKPDSAVVIARSR
jgi:hypothetical protein